MCVWPMVVSGQCMRWALKRMSPSWIHGSHRTTSSLSAPGREAVGFAQ
ncbi:rCG54892 [Rattus norvegicus]|uniref:RCG54892 n=1 Tax=Rattus norvegicus TaxID=10116 RepID=A6IIU2_RAT|nr:rCG54892 [Rattus norvegicus]